MNESMERFLALRTFSLIPWFSRTTSKNQRAVEQCMLNVSTNSPRDFPARLATVCVPKNVRQSYGKKKMNGVDCGL